MVNKAPVRRHIQISGTVQGVGFRPFTYNLARGFGLTGWVKNNRGGVEIEAQGAGVDLFIEAIKSSPPPLADIKQITVQKIPPCLNPAPSFTIEPSDRGRKTYATEISPDISTCADCVKELFDKKDRRYLYPFVNCTNCGPRYSIIKELPYDRANTVMNAFTMCGACKAEYLDPGDRRFHAETDCCEECGPVVWRFKTGSGTPDIKRDNGPANYEAVKEAQTALNEGAIVAIKGLGGFHITCDADNTEALKRLRFFKRTSLGNSEEFGNKAFAVMAASIETAKEFALISKEEEKVLSSSSSPITLLRKKKGSELPEGVAPESDTYGVMLPYTPLHHLLFHGAGKGFRALVMTSGNRTGTPIIRDNKEAVEDLSEICDLFLLHDRVIEQRIDDSIVRISNGRATVLRRARGLTPKSIELGKKIPDSIAFGAGQKNTFCVGTGSALILGQHIGELDTDSSIEFQTASIDNLLRLNKINPKIVAHDPHPGYSSTRLALEYAKANSIPADSIFSVQHHHAHIVSCMTEHGLNSPVIGVAFDGTGAGDDGNVWGGEFLITERAKFKRAAHFKYIPMAGAERAIKEPWRMALAYILDAYKERAGEVTDRVLGRVSARERKVVTQMIRQKINSPLTSSVGRLFDALSSIIGICDIATYEGEAATGLERVAAGGIHTDKERSAIEPYGYFITESSPAIIDTAPMIRAIIEDIGNKVSKESIAGRFHVTITSIITGVSLSLSKKSGIKDVVLSGGVFQNSRLSLLTEESLLDAGLTPWYNCAIPANDGGVSLGQIVIATERFSKQNEERGDN